MAVFFGRNSGYSGFLKFGAELCHDQSARFPQHIFTHADFRALFKSSYVYIVLNSNLTMFVSMNSSWNLFDCLPVLFSTIKDIFSDVYNNDAEMVLSLTHNILINKAQKDTLFVKFV